ncbi:DUF305 domain-containing protein [Streptomyces sp. H39-S7]|uniref:DUF305 domain-containing protein n=1 Tax=Streptomyces sp. H39-S7 TaxID=3004357 RepID=UPI0022B02448|nr:DUF305 domain-containing protein [Streptomyces sp. H39-S7]MCZ4121734.1 DUF305 domain-containing protein [Streptomyces sp. H39-S7]
MTARRSLIRRSALVASTAAAAMVLAACGGSGHDMGSMDSSSSPSTTAPASTPPSAGAHNAADVDFAKQMIPHHRQAVAMADLAATRAVSTDVKALATKIKGAQDPEIRTMSSWLTSWGEPVPQEMQGMDMSSGMPGMMSMDDMDKLKKSSGAAFDSMFLQMMVKHHEGAVEMANTEKAKGQYGPTKELASAVVTAQTSEITQMNALLGKN